MKMAILVRKDLKLPPGKLAVQVAHAACNMMNVLDEDTKTKWYRNGAKKVVLWVKDERELKDLAPKSGMACFIYDAGRTVVKPGTLTCASMYPRSESAIDNAVGHLKLV